MIEKEEDGELQSWTKIVRTLVHNSLSIIFNFHSPYPHISVLCCCERDEQTTSRMMSDYNIGLGEQGVCPSFNSQDCRCKKEKCV